MKHYGPSFWRRNYGRKEYGKLIAVIVHHTDIPIYCFVCRNDAKTVSIVALGCFHPVTKVQSASLHFFLGSEEEEEEGSDEDEVGLHVMVVLTSNMPDTSRVKM